MIKFTEENPTWDGNSRKSTHSKAHNSSVFVCKYLMYAFHRELIRFCLQIMRPCLLNTLNIKSKFFDKQKCLEEKEGCLALIPVFLTLYYFPTPLFSHFTPQQVPLSLSARNLQSS
jgi:hypothetical protein